MKMSKINFDLIEKVRETKKIIQFPYKVFFFKKKRNLEKEPWRASTKLHLNGAPI
jgi:hypothetical protein